MAKGGRSLRYLTEADMPPGMRRLLRPNGLVKEPAAAPIQVSPPRHARHAAGVMNKTEAAYDQHLSLRRHAGEVSWYAFEAIKLRLAKGTFLTVDFTVLLPDHTLEFHEIKGRKGDTFWAEEDAKIKLKVAAEQFPFRVLVVWPRRGGGWNTQHVAGRA